MAQRPSIFIGYRRFDSADVAGRIFDQLEQAFGAENLFKDVDNIPIGVNFRAHVAEVIARSHIFLLLIGPRWAEAGAGGRSRLWEVDDVVRIEIEAALAARQVTIIPTLVSNADMPSRAGLPPSLHPIVDLNAAIIRQDPDFRKDITKLIGHLQTLPVHPRSPLFPPPAYRPPKLQIVPGSAVFSDPRVDPLPVPAPAKPTPPQSEDAQAARREAMQAFLRGRAVLEPAPMPMRILSEQPRIAIVGVGREGGKAVANLKDANLGSATLVAMDTDGMALRANSADQKLHLGPKLNQGLGVAGNLELGRASAEESRDAIAEVLKEFELIFLIARLGGGTGSGASPLVARVAKELGIQVVGLVAQPFAFEGERRRANADAAIGLLKPVTQALAIIESDRADLLAGAAMTYKDATELTDEVLRSVINSIVSPLVAPHSVRIDAESLSRHLSGFGVANIGFARAAADGALQTLVHDALKFATPIRASAAYPSKAILNVAGGPSLTAETIEEIAQLTRKGLGSDATLLTGSTLDPALGDEVAISVWANGLVTFWPPPLT